MVKVKLFRFQQCFVPLICCFSLGPLKRYFLEIFLIMFFGVRNFENTWAVRVIFFWKCSKFNLAFKNGASNWENVFSFWDNCIWIGCLKVSLLRREYLLWAVNVWRNSLKNLHITKREFLQLNCLHSDQ